MKNNDKKGLSRRSFLTSMGAAGAAVAGAGMIPGGFIIKSANASEAKYKLRFGASILNETNDKHLASGIYHFVKRAEELSGGELAIQVIDNGQGCAEPTCGDRVANGLFDIGGSSPQNLGSVFPYSIGLDWPMLWRSRDEYFNLLFSPKSNRLYRDIMEKNYGIVPLFGSGEMRSIMMGKQYEGEPLIRTPERLRGAKIRITNSEMIAAFTQSMEMNPTPLAFTELLEGLRTGVVDATETWPGAATGFGMHNVITQDIPVNFSPGFELVFIAARSFNKLPDNIKEALLEASYEAMIFGHDAVETAQNEVVGNGPNPSPTSAYAEAGVQKVDLSESELARFRATAGVENNEDIYMPIRKKLESIAGFDVYDELLEFRNNVAGKELMPQRWWI